MEGAAEIWAELSGSVRAFVARRASASVDPDDVVQETFLRIHRRLSELEDAERVQAWVFQIARNALIDAQRTEQRDRARSANFDETKFMAETSEDETSALVCCVASMIARLPENYRVALELTEIGSMTQAAAAAQIGISTSGMKSRVQRGREQLRALFERCCEIELDRRGHIIDSVPRAKASQPCPTCAPNPSTKKEERS